MIAFSALSSVVSHRRWGCRMGILAPSLILAATPVVVGASDHWIGIPAYELAAHRFVAEADDATAVFLNPAGLAGGHGANMYLDLTGTSDEIIEGSAALQGGSWGFAYRHRDILPRGTGVSQLNGFGIPDGPGNLDTYALASSFGKGRVRMGVARVWSNTDIPGEDAGFWRLGLQNRMSRHLSLGVVVEASNKDRFLNGRLRPRYTYGVAIRPLPASPELLTVNIQGSHSDGEADLIDLSYGASVHLNGGLRLGIAVQDPVGGDMEWGGSVTAHFGKGAVSARARSISGDEDYRALVSLQIYDEFWQQSMTAKKRVAAVDLRGAYKDLASGFVLLGGSSRGAQSLVRRIHHASTDKDISALAIRVGNVSGAFLGPVRAQHEEIRKAIHQFQKSGKPVVAYLDALCGPTELYLASVADHVVLPPLSGIQGIGVAFHQSRYSRMLENIGVEWDADTSGVYKSTFHGFYTDTTSAAQQEVIQGLVDAMFDHLVDTIQTARGLSDQDMDEVATGKILFPEDCLRLGLVDEIGWWEQATEAAARLSGNEGKPGTIPLPSRRYWTERWTPAPAVAVVSAQGSIKSGKSGRNWIMGGRSMGSRTVVRQLKAAAGHPGVRAIVFRVDSGGGSALASEEIRQEILNIKSKTKIPFLVSMGGSAASGGYWIAMDGDSVFANATTLTGSIGVVWAVPVLEKMYEKLGVTSETTKRGEFSDMMYPYRRMVPEERRMLDESLNFIYDVFVDGVARGRDLPVDRVRDLAQGRVYLGSQAVDLGLVDGLKGLNEVIEIAADTAGIKDDYRVLSFRSGNPGLVERALRSAGQLSELLLGSGLDTDEDPHISAEILD